MSRVTLDLGLGVEVGVGVGLGLGLGLGACIMSRMTLDLATSRRKVGAAMLTWLEVGVRGRA